MQSYKPMLAQSKEKPFDDSNWIFEVKWDGIRAIAYVRETLSLRSRNDEEISTKFPELSELKDLAVNVVLDGEVVVAKDGEINFQATLKRFQASDPIGIERLSKSNPATFIVFDILEKDGEPTIDLPLVERKKLLRKSVKQGKAVIINPMVEGSGLDYYEAAKLQKLEGIIAKRKSSAYLPGVRSGSWLKINIIKTCDCVVFGYTPGSGARKRSFGSLLLGVYDEDEPLYVGRVGTGFTDRDLEDIKVKLDSKKVNESWFKEPDIPEGSTWVQPELVAVIGYREYTRDNRLRLPRFQGFRSDKPAELCSINQLRPKRLEEYLSKRDFNKTPEPEGGLPRGKGNSYVVQEHHARRLHWDLRLERDGILKSWAVPKGIPSELGIRRLAVKTEDHPLDYGDFEGTIPEGQYGSGTVEIWDKGFYIPVKWIENKVEIVLAGARLKGRYELVKLEKKNEWLLFKKNNY